MTRTGLGVLAAGLAILSASGCSQPPAPSNQQAAALPPPPVAAPVATGQVPPLDPALRERIRQRDARIAAAKGGQSQFDAYLDAAKRVQAEGRERGR